MKTRLLLTFALLLGGIAGHAQEIDVPRVEFSNPAVRVLQNFNLKAGGPSVRSWSSAATRPSKAASTRMSS